MRFMTITAVLASSVWLCDRPAVAQTSGCESLVGTWDYMEPSPSGRAIIAKLQDKYTIVFFQEDKPAQAAPTGSNPSDNFGAGVSEYTCEGSNGKYKWKMHALHSLDPKAVGVERTLEMDVQGDIAKWSFIDKDGKRVNPGAAKRAR